MESEGTNEGKESSITTRILSSSQNGFGGSRDKNIFEIVTISEVKAKKGAFDTCAKKLIIASISMFWFIACTAYSTIAPFFPGEVMIYLRSFFNVKDRSHHCGEFVMLKLHYFGKYFLL